MVCKSASDAAATECDPPRKVLRSMGMDRVLGGCVVARLWTPALHSPGWLALVRLAEEGLLKRSAQSRRPLNFSGEDSKPDTLRLSTLKSLFFAGVEGWTASGVIRVGDGILRAQCQAATGLRKGNVRDHGLFVDGQQRGTAECRFAWLWRVSRAVASQTKRPCEYKSSRVPAHT